MRGRRNKAQQGRRGARKSSRKSFFEQKMTFRALPHRILVLRETICTCHPKEAVSGPKIEPAAPLWAGNFSGSHYLLELSVLPFAYSSNAAWGVLDPTLAWTREPTATTDDERPIWGDRPKTPKSKPSPGPRAAPQSRNHSQNDIPKQNS